jgi:hypothetical protein
MATTAIDLAVQLGVDEGNVEVLFQQLGQHEPEPPEDWRRLSATCSTLRGSARGCCARRTTRTAPSRS